MTKVKICCIKSLAEAMLAIDLGASALGFVSQMPSGPGVIEETVIRDVIAKLPSEIMTFLLSSKTDFDQISDQLNFTNANTLQMVDYISSEIYLRLKDSFPSTKLVQVVHVLGEDDIERSVQVSKFVDIILLDSGNPGLMVKELGGTGKTHNWQISKAIVEAVDVPVFLAGGLNPGNINEAISHVIPYGVDLCSGVRENGNLSESLLSSFMKNVNDKTHN